MSIKHTLLKAAPPTGLAALARLASGGALRILGYHGVWITPGHAYGNCTFIAPEQFERRMARLRRSGCPVLPLDEAVERLAARDLPRAAVVITIDDGWASTYTHMLPVLEAYELPATLYATTWYSAHQLPVINQVVDYLCEAAGRADIDRGQAIQAIECLPVDDRLAAVRAFGAGLGVAEDWLERRQFHNMTALDLADAQARGLDIQLHTHRHIDVTSRIDELDVEIADNHAFLQTATGAAHFAHFCYPGGGYHDRAGQMLTQTGIRSATLCDEGINPPGTNPHALRRLLDGRDVCDATFDAYLSGTLHYLDSARRLLSRRASPSS